jgi:hypothetical protein
MLKVEFFKSMHTLMFSHLILCPVLILKFSLSLLHSLYGQRGDMYKGIKFYGNA